ncbi:hypothetical protein ACF0H2_01090 [Serratia marcescens]
MIEARKLDDLLEPLDIGLAWRRGSARPELVTPFLTIARENGSKHAAGLSIRFNRTRRSVFRICCPPEARLG